MYPIIQKFKTCLLVAAITLVGASANAITVVTQEFDLHGHWADSWQVPDDPADEPYTWPTFTTTGTFGIASTDGTPISGVFGSPNNWNVAQGSVSTFSLSLGAVSRPNVQPNEPVPGAVGNEGGPSYIQIFGSSITRFTPDASELVLGLAALMYFNHEVDDQFMRVALSDVTAGNSSVFALDLVGFQLYDELYSFSLDPSHIYELAITGWIDSMGGNHADLTATASVILVAGPPPGEPIPDGGMTLALFAGGLGLIAIQRRRRSR